MTELMADSVINKEWLEWYGDAWRVYEDYLKQKDILIKRIGTLKAVSYDKDKVINGSSSHLSEQERYTMRLEKINSYIKECEEILLPAKERLKQHIRRIKKAEYRKILILRYIERWKWTDIIQECFWYEEDINTNFEKYKDKCLFWNRSALKQLEEITEKPYIKAETQLNLLGKET